MVDNSGDAPTSSVVLDPVESLTFHLHPGASPQAVLTIRNTSDSRKVAFKVKTTRPMRYLVRPNQGMLGPNMTASIVVILQQKDCDELLRLDPAERQLSNDKFLVQSSYVDDSFYELVKAKSTKDMADELTNMWAKADKKSLANKKLRCRFAEDGPSPDETETATTMPSAPASANAQTTSVKNDAETADVDLTSHEGLTQALLLASSSSSPAAAPPGGLDSTVADVAALKRKYDELVSYTVQMTAQREDMLNDLKRARQELKELQDARVEAPTLRQRKGGAGAGATHANNEEAARGGDRAVAVRDATSFTLVHLLVCAIVFFVIGRFY